MGHENAKHENAARSEIAETENDGLNDQIARTISCSASPLIFLKIKS